MIINFHAEQGLEGTFYFSDFEHGIFRMFSKCFPQVPVSGCDVHFKNALQRNIDKKGLEPLHCNEDDNYSDAFQIIVRYGL